MGVILVDAGLDERPRQSAHGRAGPGTNERGPKPPRWRRGARPRDGEHAEAGEKASPTAGERADGSPRAGAVADIVIMMVRAIEGAAGMGRVAVTLVAGDQADVATGNAGSLQAADGFGGILVAVEERRDGLVRHDRFTSSERMRLCAGILVVGWNERWRSGLLGLNRALVVDAHADRLAVALGLAAPDALIVLAQLGDVAEALRLKAGARLRFGEAVGTGLDRAR